MLVIPIAIPVHGWARRVSGFSRNRKIDPQFELQFVSSLVMFSLQYIAAQNEALDIFPPTLL